MIQIYKNVISKEVCEDLIQQFESSQKTEFDIFEQTEMTEFSQKEYLLTTIQSIADHYKKLYDPLGMIPKEKKIEAFRIKRYTPNKHSFPLHVDVGNSNNCTRYLAFLLYLNDSEAGTKFYTPQGNFTFEANCGNIVVFPPMWMFPHEGLLPTENFKYIMSTYYHYV